jgi:hypothetical protein
MHITAPQPASAYPVQHVQPTKEPGPEVFLAVIREMLQRNPPRGAMLHRTAAAAELGIGADARDWTDLPADVRAGWTAAWPALQAVLRDPATLRAHTVAGWEFPPPEIGQWGDNLMLRASNALRGIAALDITETLYLSTMVDIAGQPLDGRERYLVRLPAAGLPVRGFWSLTLYEAMPDGRYFLADGSIELQLQPDPPADIANWLPTPRAPFRLTLRAYLPEPALVQGQVTLPRVERIAGT